MIDLVMWSKHGPSEEVLGRIDAVLQDIAIAQKVLVIDAYSDLRDASYIKHDWRLALNEGTGISGAANTALKLVSTDVFASFEDDLLLSGEWCWKVMPLVSPSTCSCKVAIASGMRFADKPKGLTALEKYVARKYKGEAEVSSWLKSREASAFTLGKTLDNTVYNTNILRAIGGFPKLSTPVGTETALACRVEEAGYRWVVDYSVQSVHLRKGLMAELKHQSWYASQKRATTLSVIYRFLLSPFTGLFVAVKMQEPSVAYIHPLIKFYYMKGALCTTNLNLPNS